MVVIFGDRNLISSASGVEYHAKIPHHYIPQKNGVFERMNITLMDKARSMLSGVGVAQDFWAEAVDTEKYMVNMSP
jgi:hypothetical protein